MTTHLIKKLEDKIENMKQEIADLEDQSYKDDPNSKYNSYVDPVERVRVLKISLKEGQERLFRLRTSTDADFQVLVHDMKVISEHVNLVNEKYECRTVKFLCAVADFFEKPRSKKIADSIRNYVTNKINAPVCSITGNPKPALEPMPRSGELTTQERMRQLLDSIKGLA
jgi:hypothetical protein